jgi:glycine/D-amino acid oxidase-like deaminating enzyme
MPARVTPLAESFQATPYWWEAAPPERCRDESLPKETEVAIVGAGYCGLCCALELAENGVSAALLEAGELGTGASTRNGGMVTGGQKFVVSGATASLPAAMRTRILEDARDSLTALEGRVERYGLDADYQRCGRVILAEILSHYRRLERWGELLRTEARSDVALIPRAQLTDEIGGSRYFGGLLIADYGGLHPAKYHRALRQALRARGGHAFSHAPVVSIERAGAEFRVRTGRGELRARHVLVATNGYTGALVPYFHERVVPVASYIIATEQLPAGLADRLSPRRRMFSDTKRDLYYFRLSPDGTRVVFGSRPGIFNADLETAARSLHRQVCGVWPEINDIKVEFCWTGNVGMSADKVPHMGTHDGIHYALACNGSGVAMMSYLGYQSALKIMGRQNRPCAFDRATFPRPPAYRGTPWFVPLVAGWHRARDAIDRMVG